MHQLGSVVGRMALIVACGALLFACETSNEDTAGTSPVTDVIEDAAQADGSSDVVTSPDVAAPDVVEPDVAAPDATAVDATEPDATGPDATEPDVMEPDATLVDATEPDATEPDAAEPDAAEPDAAEPDATEPDATEPDATEPKDTCFVAEDCTFTQYKALVTSEEQCFCPMCPTIPVTVAEHNARAKAWDEHCGDWAIQEPCPVPGCTDPGEATCSAGQCVAEEKPQKCMATGCSGEICAEMEMMSTCDVEPWYACLELTTCGSFADGGGCGWELNDAFIACMEEMGKGDPPTCAEDVVCLSMPPICPEGLTPVSNGGGCWGGCGFPETCSCDDGSLLTCKKAEPVCTEDTVLAVQNGCYECVDPMTCGVDSGPGPKGCGGFAGFQCEDGLECVDDPTDECDPKNGGADCPGICVEPTEPGGCEGPNPAGCFTTGCPGDQQCVAEGCTPSSCSCDEEAGLWICTKDCGGGICVDGIDEPAPCGGIMGLLCKDGFECVDDPSDGCDPKKGGADCPGICVEPAVEPEACTSNDECTFTQYDILVTDESECFCPMCPTLPVTVDEHNARHAAWQEHCTAWQEKEPCPVPGCMDPGEAICSEGQCMAAPSDCFTTGCSSEICSDMEMMSTCDIQPWYACLELTSCGNFGENGTCAWEMTSEFEACLDSFDEPPGCSTDGVMCKMLPPECPEGLTPVEQGVLGLRIPEHVLL